MRLRAALSLPALLLLAAPAFGQTGEEQAPESRDRCRPSPDEQESAGPDVDMKDREPLSDMLEDCGAVLPPPPTGDSEIAEPPPDVGETPVIRPQDIPEQQNPNET